MEDRYHLKNKIKDLFTSTTTEKLYLNSNIDENIMI